MSKCPNCGSEELSNSIWIMKDYVDSKISCDECNFSMGLRLPEGVHRIMSIIEVHKFASDVLVLACEEKAEKKSDQPPGYDSRLCSDHYEMVAPPRLFIHDE